MILLRAIEQPKKDKTFLITDQKVIFVGGIPKMLTDHALVEHFRKFGSIEEFVMPKSQTNQCLNRGYAFITFFSISSVQNTMNYDGNHNLNGKTVK